MASDDTCKRVGAQILLIDTCEHKRSNLTFSRFQKLFYGQCSEDSSECQNSIADQFLEFKSNFGGWFKSASLVTKIKYIQLLQHHIDRIQSIDLEEEEE